jgi:hypothetical protein
MPASGGRYGRTISGQAGRCLASLDARVSSGHHLLVRADVSRRSSTNDTGEVSMRSRRTFLRYWSSLDDAIILQAVLLQQAVVFIIFVLSAAASKAVLGVILRRCWGGFSRRHLRRICVAEIDSCWALIRGQWRPMCSQIASEPDMQDVAYDAISAGLRLAVTMAKLDVDVSAGVTSASGCTSYLCVFDCVKFVFACISCRERKMKDLVV